MNKKGAEHASGKLHLGNWDWHSSYVFNGEVKPKFESLFRILLAIILLDLSFFDSAWEELYYETTYPGSMNLRFRIHLPLIVPLDTKPDAFSKHPKTKCGLRVGDQIRTWKEGKAVVLDDSYEHEVWNETKDVRVLLLLDIWVSYNKHTCSAVTSCTAISGCCCINSNNSCFIFLLPGVHYPTTRIAS